MKIKSLLCGLVCLCLLSGCGGKQTTAEVSSYDSEYVSSYEDTSSVTLDTTSVLDTSSTSTEVVSSETISSKITSKAESKVVSETSSKTSSKVSSKAPNKTESKVSNNTSSKVSSTQSTQKPAEDKNKKYQAEIEAENERHEKVIDEANRYCDMLVEANEERIQDLRWNYDVYSGSQSQYNREMSALDEEIDKTQRRIGLLSRDTSGIYRKEIERLEAELDDMLSEKTELTRSWIVKEEIQNIEEDIKSFRIDRNYKIQDENKLHEENINKIKEKYGM